MRCASDKRSRCRSISNLPWTSTSWMHACCAIWPPRANGSIRRCSRGFLPRKLIPVCIEQTGIPAEQGGQPDHGPGSRTRLRDWLKAVSPGGDRVSLVQRGDRYCGRRGHARGRPAHDGLQAGRGALFCGRGAGRGRGHGRVQPAGGLFHRMGGGARGGRVCDGAERAAR